MSLRDLFSSPSPLWLRVCVLVTVGIGLWVSFAFHWPSEGMPSMGTSPTQAAEEFARAFLQGDEEGMRRHLWRGAPLDSLNHELFTGRGMKTTRLVPSSPVTKSTFVETDVTFTLRLDEAGQTTIDFPPSLGDAQKAERLRQVDQSLALLADTQLKVKLGFEGKDWRVRSLEHHSGSSSAVHHFFVIVRGAAPPRRGGTPVNVPLLTAITPAERGLMAPAVVPQVAPLVPGTKAAPKGKASPPPLAAADAGPFRVSAEVNEDRPHATATLKLTAAADTLPASVRETLLGYRATLSDVTVRGPAGRDLLFVERWQRARARPAAGKAAGLSLPLVSEVPLRHLTADVAALSQVTGTLTLPLPVRVSPLRLDLAAPSGRATAGGVTLSWSLHSGYGLLLARTDRFTLKAEGPADRVIAWRDARAGGIDATDIFRCPANRTVHLVPGAVSCECRVVEVEPAAFPFRLSDVPLPNRPLQKLEPPRFPAGKPPVSVAELELSAPTVRFRVVNHTQKRIEEIRFRLRGLDAKGAVVKEVHHSHDFDGQKEKYLGPGASAAVQLSPAWPAEVDRWEPEAVRLLFVDGTLWSAGAP